MKSELIEHVFMKGEVLTNNCGSVFEIENILEDGKILFRRISDGYRLIAVGTKMYIKRDLFQCKEEAAIEWDYSKEIGWN